MGATLRAVALACLAGAACGRARVEHVVTMSGMTFTPASLTVRAGDVVVWRNDDLVAHTATAAGRFDSGTIEPGGGFRVTVSRKGAVEYACAIHPMMKGQLVVE